MRQPVCSTSRSFISTWRTSHPLPGCLIQLSLAFLPQRLITPAEAGVRYGESGDDLLSPARGRLSLARTCFTVLFGKGRGGSTSLWSPDETGYTSSRGDASAASLMFGLNWVQAFGRRSLRMRCIPPGQIALAIQGYRVKPYGQLVLVSLTHYCASTPSLSTLWSSTTLQGGQASGRSHLQASFTLRCFQRLSLPHLATRRYHWRDNRYTRGASTPVLSY